MEVGARMPDSNSAVSRTITVRRRNIGSLLPDVSNLYPASTSGHDIGRVRFVVPKGETGSVYLFIVHRGKYNT
jgi:hypothetical protein